jgi:hypothetical protein
MHLEGLAAVNAFLTYVDSKAQNILKDSGATDKDNWIEFKADVIKALSQPQASVQARFELKKATQQIDETVEMFGQRLMNLARTGYSDAEQQAKQSALKDALAGGVRRDELAVHLINISDQIFSNMLAEAIKLDASYLARQALKKDENYSVAVMNTQLQQGVEGDTEPQVNQVMFNAQTNNSGILCFRCRQPGHIATYCPLLSNDARVSQGYNSQKNVQNFAAGSGIPQGRSNQCYYCFKENNVAKDCSLRKRDQRMSQPQFYGRRFTGNQGTNRPRYFPDRGQILLQNHYGYSAPSSSPKLRPVNFRAPLEDKAFLAYNAALERQTNRNFAAESGTKGQVNEAVGGLGFEQYTDQGQKFVVVGAESRYLAFTATNRNNLRYPR